MAATLSDDLMLEYDMIQLVAGHDSIDSNLSKVCASPEALPKVEKYSEGVTNTAVSSGPCTSSTCALGGADCSISTNTMPLEEESITRGDSTDVLLDDEQILRDVVNLYLDSSENQKFQTTLEKSNGALDLSAFADLDSLASPCSSSSSTCLPSVNESPCKTDVNEFNVERLKMEEVRELPALSTGHILPAIPSPKLSHANLLPFETSPRGRAPNSDMTTSRMSFKESINESELMGIYDEEDEKMDDEIIADEVDLLEKEAKYLDAQKDFLQSRARMSRPRRQSIKKHRSREAESNLLVRSLEDNKLLSELVMQQKVYQENLKAMLALAPVNEVRMALMTPMESYIHLSKDFNERRQKLLSLRDEKLDTTYKFIEQKAAGLDYNKPYQYSDMFEKFGKHYCINFAISKYDGVSIYQVGRALYEQIAGKDEALNKAMGSTTICESFDTIKCNFMHQRIVSSMNWEGDSAEKMPDMESNTIFYCRFGDDSAVFLTDYIDQDDLHPYDASNCIRRDISSGVVLSRHTDSSGMNFVVMKRYIMAKYHMYPHKVSKEQQDRYFADMPKRLDAMKSLVIDRLQQGETCP